MIRFLAVTGLAALCLSGPVLAQSLNFGDDASEYSNDGECDDPRFEGPGMTSTPLLDADIAHDATDCAAAFAAGLIAPRAAEDSAQGADPTGVADGSSAEGDARIVVDGIDFGDDSSQYATDTECDDPRFEGPGMATALVASDLGRDATDCAAAYVAGTVTPRLPPAEAATPADLPAGVDFGDDSSTYANDGECDDPRFQGPGAATTLLEADLGHDATDCIAAFSEGRIDLRAGPAPAAPEVATAPEMATAPAVPTMIDGIDFGDDSGGYPADGECDDPRFAGAAMATALEESNTGRDATDCAAAYAAGQVMLDDAPAMRRPAAAAVSAEERASRRRNRAM